MFGFRVDIDSRYGLLHGVPKLLEVFRRQEVRASFYIPMGGESTLYELLHYRGEGSGIAGGVRLPKSEILRMALLPRNFAQENSPLLHRIVEEGHNLGVHGFKHRLWTRGMSEIDVGEHVRLATEKFGQIMGHAPVSFASPAFKTNLKVLEALDKYSYKVAGDMVGAKPFFPVVGGRRFHCCQVPITLLAPSTDPLFEYYCSKGLTDEAVAARICGDIDSRMQKGELATIYCHDFFEGMHKPQVVEAVLKHVRKCGYPHKTMEGIGATARDAVSVTLAGSPA